MAVLVTRPWFGLRRVVGWGQASRRQPITVTLGALCALSIVAGGALAAAGVGKAGPFAPPAPASANRALAAAWIAQQASPGVTVSCDPAMCRRLRADGLPAVRVKPLPPVASSPLGSVLIVSTPVVRSQFGARLAAAYAPLVIAGFGAGAERVDVRVIAPDGAAAFESKLAAEHAFLLSAGAQLLRDQNIQAAPAARAVLLAGGADSRLLATLSVLAAGMPVQLEAFDDPQPEASSAVPLRGAEIGTSSAAGISAVLAFLHAQQGAYRPTEVAVVRAANGQRLVSVRFGAPGLMDAGAS
ncbi:MAG TPA: hypothetical protein VIZ20_20750 [Streptosporangiaceae bacterium]